MAAGDLIIWISIMLGIAIMLPSMVSIQHTAFTDQVARVEAGQLPPTENAALQDE